MNFRVALQYEFTALHLDDCLERLGHHESDELAVQISAYVENEFNVAELMEEAELKGQAMEQVADLEQEIKDLKTKREEVETEYSTLKRTVKNKEEEGRKRLSIMEVRIKELEVERDQLKTASNSSLSSSQSGGTPSLPSMVAPPPPAPPPPPSMGPPPPPPPAPPGGLRPGAPPPPPGPPGRGPLGSGPPPPPPAGGLDTRTLKPAHKTTYRLPTLQLAVLKPNDTKDTFWYTTNDDKIIKEIDFSAFEEAFKLNPAPIKKAGGRDEPDPGKVPTIKTPQLKSLMEHTRLKNVAICKRRLPPMPLDDIMAAVNALDNSTISLDAIELLQRIEPNAEEIKAYREFNFKKQDPNELTEEDRFMLKLSKVERLPAKLEIMSFMSTYYEFLHAVRPRIEAIHLASKATRNAKKFKKILEIILAFGNYMNSAKKGSAYGFKMASLDNLTITKSSDKKTTIVNYLVDIVSAKYPELKGFEGELRYIDKAAQFSLENVMTDVNELEKGMKLTLRELEARQCAPSNASKTQRNIALKDFCENVKRELKKLKVDANNAKASFIDCLEHFGEDSKTLDANAFFAILVRFCASWKAAEVENVKREKLKKAQEAQKAQQENNNQGNQMNNSTNNKNQANLNKKNMHNSLIAELKNKNVGTRKPIRQIPQDEIKDGTFEQIIMDIKSEPYCPRRSIRRNTDRLTSRPFDGEDL